MYFITFEATTRRDLRFGAEVGGALEPVIIGAHR